MSKAAVKEEALPDWINKAREAYEQGASDVEICRILNVTQKKFDEYYKTNREFQKFIDLGRMMSTAWWHSQGRTNLNNKGFNTSLWSFNMKNRFGWAEKVDQTSTSVPEDQLSIDDMKSKITKLQERMYRTMGFTEAQVLEKTNGFDPSKPN